ncbi:MAG: glycosyltransferase family 4 protein [Clostridia bacterium]|nr:glycosyltransferase family 4 protein [Clostridia bacterium]
MKKINICFHINNISKCGGTERVTTDIASALIEKYKNKYNIFVLSNYRENEPYFKGNNKIKYISLFNNKKRLAFNYFKYVTEIKNIINKYNIDVIISVDTILSLVDIPATIKSKCKNISWDHFSFSYKSNSLMMKISRYFSSKKADLIITLTDDSVMKYKKFFGRCNNIMRIYNPINIKKMNHKYDPLNKTILSVGRLSYEKGFDYIIEVGRKLIQKNHDFKWVILGDGPEKDKLISDVHKYNLEKNIFFQGRTSNVGDSYKNTKFFVMPSRTEGFGIVLLEAMSYGLPVISFDCESGPAEIIRNNVNGYLVKDFNIDEMTNKIIKLLSDNDLCVKFSDNSKVDFERFDEDTIIVEWDNALTLLLGGKNEKN